MNSPEQPFTSRDTEEQLPRDSLSLKELGSMLEEMKTSENEVLRIIEDVLLEPIPELTDPESQEEFNQKMATIKEIAQSQLARADLLADIESRIEERIARAHS